MNNLSIILGKRLLSIGDVAEGTGLNRNTISSIYHRKATNINLKTLVAICDYLQVPLSELIEYVPDKK
ncbi:helix-turn-helix domain-containing protein [Companilactobacillus kedongensis]|uniref:helix-turn-helix domain-containing protein n=1 Tax=Companilactobacillus kedongensis TaxID=2486004 RepID=UPI000F7681AB|nr:helix-turn-helix transcriptional regulator [Companilactobacillus kedongensis]